MEVRQETDYAHHHIQKVMAFFGAMRAFAEHLRQAGHRVAYVALDDPDNRQSIEGNLRLLVEEYAPEWLEYQFPDEFRLDELMLSLAGKLGVKVRAYDSEHFLADRLAVARHFTGRKTYLLESFYRLERQRHGYLVTPEGQPEGGRWNFDADNRQALPKDAVLPEPFVVEKDLTDLHRMIVQAGVRTMGQCADPSRFIWPTTRAECQQLLEHFAHHALPLFGRYEDAMTKRHWLLYHSRLSFAMNVKLLSPAEVIERCIAEYRARPDEITLPQIEGFVRQIAGWREYVRGLYWALMPDFGRKNHFGHQTPLPSWFWTGETDMACLRHALGQSLELAYAHHIQRLMVIGNFALLIGADPDEVDAWYLGVYIDAIEWVEMPNTRGMSQYADGGLVGTKPYVSSAAYIQRMSDYCQGCKYDYKKKTGEGACPFNSLYWHFHARHRHLLERNPRIGHVYPTWDKMPAENRAALLDHAEHVLAHLEEL